MTGFCPDEEALSLWIERKLPEAEDHGIARHLAACDGCRRAVTLAVLSVNDAAASLAPAGEERLLRAVEGALARPAWCPPEDSLGAWLADRLAPADREAVSAHLASCDECRRTAALTRLAKESPVAALSAAQEQAALRIVLGHAQRAAVFTAGRLVAAAAVVAVAVTYLAVQWNAGVPASSGGSAAVETPDRHAFVAPRKSAGTLVARVVPAETAVANPSGVLGSFTWYRGELEGAVTHHPRLVLEVTVRGDGRPLVMAADGYSASVPAPEGGAGVVTLPMSELRLNGAAPPESMSWSSFVVGVEAGGRLVVESIEIRRLD